MCWVIVLFFPVLLVMQAGSSCRPSFFAGCDPRGPVSTSAFLSVSTKAHVLNASASFNVVWFRVVVHWLEFLAAIQPRPWWLSESHRGLSPSGKAGRGGGFFFAVLQWPAGVDKGGSVQQHPRFSKKSATIRMTAPSKKTETQCNSTGGCMHEVSRCQVKIHSTCRHASPHRQSSLLRAAPDPPANQRR